MREMSQGQWVAFDVGSDEPHQHGVAGRKSNKVIVKKSKTPKITKPKKLRANQIIDRSGEIYDIQDLPLDWLDLDETNLQKIFMLLIGRNFSVQIEYQDQKGDITNREIYPLSLIHGLSNNQSSSSSLKLVSYCKLREDYRTFLLDSIEELKIDGEIPNSFMRDFDSLSVVERQNILNGKNFYGNYRHESLKTFDGHAPSRDSSFINKSSDPEHEALIEDYLPEQNAEESSNIGTWIFWGFIIIVLFNLI